MNLKIGVAGFAVQAAKGAAEAQPAYCAGPVGGGKLVVARGRADRGRAHVGARSAGVGEFRESRRHHGRCEGRVWPASIGGLLYAVLGAIQTVGAAAPYTHTITPAAAAAVVHGLRREGHRAQVAPPTRSSTRSRSSGRATARSRSRRRGLASTSPGRDVAYVPAPDETDVELPQGHQPRRRVLDLDGAGYDGGAVRAGRLGRDQAQPHRRHEVRPARAGRPLRGRLRVRRRAQGPRAGPAAGAPAAHRRRRRRRRVGRRALRRLHAHVRRCADSVALRRRQGRVEDRRSPTRTRRAARPSSRCRAAATATPPSPQPSSTPSPRTKAGATARRGESRLAKGATLFEVIYIDTEEQRAGAGRHRRRHRRRPSGPRRSTRCRRSPSSPARHSTAEVEFLIEEYRDAEVRRGREARAPSPASTPVYLGAQRAQPARHRARLDRVAAAGDDPADDDEAAPAEESAEGESDGPSSAA